MVGTQSSLGREGQSTCPSVQKQKLLWKTTKNSIVELERINNISMPCGDVIALFELQAREDKIKIIMMESS